MLTSLFVQFAAWFVAIAKDVESRVNGKLDGLSYMYKDMYKPELSTNLKWESLSEDGSVVSADVVSMDSALPLKKRGTHGLASGDIPKLGMKMYLSEKQMSDIDILKARNVETATLVGKMFDDTVKVILGIHEKREFMGLQLLSSGVTVIEDENNVGLGVRIDIGYKNSNKLGVVTPWSDRANAKPMDDIRRAVNHAKSFGANAGFMWMSDTTFNDFAANAQARQEYAFSQNFSGDNSNIPSPNVTQVNAFLKANGLPQVVVINRTVVSERDGVRTVHTPWEANKVVFTQSMQVGKLWYGILAEETRPNKAVMYTKSDNILVKKWHTNEPFSEFTSSQSLSIPIVSNPGSVVILDAEEAAIDTQTEGDANFRYKDANYTRTSVISAINLATGKTTAKSTNTDATLLKYVNELTDAQIETFEANITLAA